MKKMGQGMPGMGAQNIGDNVSEPERAPLDFRIISRLYTYTRPYSRQRNILLCLVLLRGGQLALMAWVIGAVINGPVAAGNVSGTLLGATGFLALAAFTQFTLYFRQKLAMRLGESVVHDLRRDLFDHLLAMPMAFFDKMKLGRILSRVTSDIESVRSGVQSALFVTLVNGTQMLVATVMMLWVDPVMFLVLLAMGPFIYLLNHIYHRRMSNAARRQLESFSRVTATLAESVNGIRVTQGFVREDVNAAIFGELVNDHAKNNLAFARTSAMFVPMLDFTTQLFIALLLIVGGYRVLTPGVGMTIGNLVQFFFLADVFFAPFQHLGRIFTESLSAMAGGERIFRLLDTPPAWSDASDAMDLPPVSGKIEFQDVCFEYEPGKPVLKDFNLTVEPGQMIALVGHTGSGKSTVTSLLAKFHLPSAGRICIDGYNLQDVKGDSLHRQMGIIQQVNFLFNGTIMDNIRLSRPGATDEEVVEAAVKLDCRDLIESLPQGFHTEVGEKGANLSLGQRQIVCIIRAMLANPRILVLDEATSSVDVMTETRIQKALATLIRGRTSFVVAHRLSTIRHAAQVVVLDHGSIAESGTHLELLQRNGVYAGLYRQFVRIDEHP